MLQADIKYTSSPSYYQDAPKCKYCFFLQNWPNNKLAATRSNKKSCIHEKQVTSEVYFV